MPIYTGSIAGPARPGTASSYSSSLSFSPCPHRVLTVCIPPPLKYLMLLWNIYCCYEIYIAALKYVLPLWNIIAAPKYILPLRNMLSRRHAHVRKPSLYSKIWAPTHERVHKGLVPDPVLLPCSYRVLTVCHRLYPPGEKFWVCPKLSPGLAGR